jgi:PPOX class probable F420-dependent enzyme
MASARPLTPPELEFLAGTRTAVLATIDADGAPRLLPICFVAIVTAAGLHLYTPIDEKPKKVDDPLALGRVRDVLARPSVRVLVDRWSEDWSQLGWLRLDGRAELVGPDSDTRQDHSVAVAALRAKYPQYATHDLESRPVIRIAIDRTVSWGNLGA